MLTVLLGTLLQVALPPPRGYVNDFARIIDPASAAHLESTIAEVKDKTHGEIVVVTLPDIGDQAESDVALEIGRAWKVGPGAPVGDPTKNLGVIVLVVPRKNHRPGTGHIFISTGRGAEGFLTDASAGRIRDAMTPDLAREDYGAALTRGVDLIAQAFAHEFGVDLTSQPPDDGGSPTQSLPVGWIIAGVILLILLSRGRILLLPLLFGGFGGGRGSWGGGDWGGGGGGGFGGFGGGGGFSGGGAGGRF